MRCTRAKWFWKSTWARPRLDRSTEVDAVLNRRQVRDRKNAKVRPFSQLFKTTYFRRSRSPNGLCSAGAKDQGVVLSNPAMPWAPPWAGQLNRKNYVGGVFHVREPHFGSLGDSTDASIAALLRIKAAWDVEDQRYWRHLSSAAGMHSYHHASQSRAPRGVDQVSSVLNADLFSPGPSQQICPRYQLESRQYHRNTVADVIKIISSINSVGVLALGKASVLYLTKAIATFELRMPAMEVACAVAFAEHFHSLSAIECLEGCRSLLRVSRVFSAYRDAAEDSQENLRPFFASSAPALEKKLWMRLPDLWMFFSQKDLLLDAIELIYLAHAVSGFSIPRMLLPENSVTRAAHSLKYCFLRFTLGIEPTKMVSTFQKLSEREAILYLGILLRVATEAWDDLSCSSLTSAAEKRRLEACATWLKDIRSLVGTLRLPEGCFPDADYILKGWSPGELAPVGSTRLSTSTQAS